MEARSSEGKKVRQPLALLKIKLSKPNTAGLEELIKDEVNVKKVEWGSDFESADTKLWLDTSLTPELKNEGLVRDLIRAIQEMRKDKKLEPKDIISLSIDTTEGFKKVIGEFAQDIKSTVGAKEIIFTESLNDLKEIILGDLVVKISF